MIEKKSEAASAAARRANEYILFEDCQGYRIEIVAFTLRYLLHRQLFGPDRKVMVTAATWRTEAIIYGYHRYNIIRA